MENKGKWRSMMIIIGKVLLTIGIVVILAVVAVTGIIMPKKYDDVYQKDYYNSFDDVRSQIVSFGVLAPSSHNVQSWRVIFDEEDDERMEVYLNSDRVLPFVDSNCNQLVISLGVFISYMQEGASQLGYSMDIAYFTQGVLPESPTIDEIQNTLIAEIKITKNVVDPISVDSIGGATKRLPYKDVELSSETLGSIANLNGFLDMEFKIYSEEKDLKSLKEILISGIEVESKNEMAMKETAEMMRYTTYQKNKKPFGLSLHSDNPSVLTRTITEFMAVVFKQPWEKDGEFWYKRDSKNIEETNYFGMIVSSNNTRYDQINTGLLYGEISIYAHANNLEIQPLYQVLQNYPSMIELNSRINSEFNPDDKHIQMIFRLGEVDTEVSNGLRLTVGEIIE